MNVRITCGRVFFHGHRTFSVTVILLQKQNHHPSLGVYKDYEIVSFS